MILLRSTDAGLYLSRNIVFRVVLSEDVNVKLSFKWSMF
jgi:hypothetical protein